MKRVLPLLVLLWGSAACYRPAFRTVTVHLPEVESEVELRALADLLLEENQRVHADDPLFLEVVARPETPGLEVTFNPLHLSLKNVEHRLANVGYTANEIPGVPGERERFRDGLAP